MIDYPAPLKIGYIVKMFPRLSETFILNEILELERNGVEVVIFSIKKPNEGRFHPQLSGLKAKVFYLEDFDSKKWPHWISPQWSELSSYSHRIWELLGEALAAGDNSRIEYIWWAAWIASQSNKLGLMRLHAHFASMPSTIAYFTHRINGMPFSFTAHAKDIYVYTMDEHYLREKLSAANFVVTVTNYNKRYLLEKAPEIDAEKIKVIYNGINLEYFKPDSSVTRKESLILGVGRLVVKKGFGDLLEACQLLKKKNISFQCLIVGEGPEALELEKARKTLGLENEVTFTGAKNLEEVFSLMQTATLFCLPCKFAPDNNVDALPTVLLEALACGLPIVSTNISGTPEIVDSNENGLLVEQNDPKALSNQMERLLSSPILRASFAEKGREKAVDKFDLHKNVKTLIKNYLKKETKKNTNEVIVKSQLTIKEADAKR